MEIIFKEICVPFLLTIIRSGQTVSVSQEDCFHGSSAAAVWMLKCQWAGGLLPLLFEEDISFSPVNVF